MLKNDMATFCQYFSDCVTVRGCAHSVRQIFNGTEQQVVDMKFYAELETAAMVRNSTDKTDRAVLKIEEVLNQLATRWEVIDEPLGNTVE